MSSLIFPDVNVWLALVSHEHVHSAVARQWWKSHQGELAFCRISQLGLLRLLTTASVMGNKPLSLDRSWQIYEELFADDRVTFIYERPEIDAVFRAKAVGHAASPKMWADAWLLAMASAAGGTLVTFDRALASHGAHCLLPK